MLISFSGLDCAGKSTQIEIIKSYYEELGYKVLLRWSRVGYTPVLEWAKNLLRRKSEIERSSVPREIGIDEKPRGGKFLMYLSIIDLSLYYGIYFRFLCAGMKKMLICDRYFWDSYIDLLLKYRNVPFYQTIAWKFAKLMYKKPDCSFVLTVTPEESIRRSGLKVEPFPESKERRELRLEQYLKLINQNKWQYVIDCMRPIDVIHHEIRTKIDENLYNA